MEPVASLDDDAAHAAPPPRRRRLRSTLLVACALLGIGAILFRLMGPKPIPPPEITHYSPNQAKTAERHIDALRDQILAPPVAPPAPQHVAEIHRAETHRVASHPSPVPKVEESDVVRLQLSQADLNAYLTTDPRMKALLAAKGVRAVQIVLRQPNGIVCRASVVYRGHPANIQIAGNLLPSRKTVLRLDATSAQVGRLPLPVKFVTGEADKLAAALTGRMQGRLPLIVQNVQVIGDRLVLIGKRQAAATPGT